MKPQDQTLNLRARFKYYPKETLEFFFEKFYRPLYHFAYSIINDQFESEDIVVETYIKLYKLRENFDSDANVKAFLYITVRNHCLNHLQFIQSRFEKVKKYAYTVDDVTDVKIEDMVDLDIVLEKILLTIKETVNGFPAGLKKTFRHIAAGRSTEEISTILNLSQSTIRVQKMEAVRRIRLDLAKKGLFKLIDNHNSYFFSRLPFSISLD